MDDMDFTKPLAEVPAASAPFKAANSRFYNADVAAALFRNAGKEERFNTSQIIFAEDEKTSKGGLFTTASRMYYLSEGEVGLSIAGKPLDVMKAGEVFGEMAVITGRPRSATASARIPCVGHSMDAKELQAALGRSPEFGLMLASVMYDRLRFIAARLASRPRPSGTPPLQLSFFDPLLIAALEASLPRTAIVRYPQQTVIFKEGQAGKFMYVVKSGRVGIAMGAEVVEIAGPGGTFGEMAVVDQSARTARAGTIDECELLSVDRPTLVSVIKSKPAFAMALLRAVAERLRYMNAQIK
ncbi:MAG: cyclic nucleotide-binding domain-containing protein [Usitatibacter sp.]